MPVDYTLYLVTDSTMVPESSTFLKQVEDSVRAGATIVQLREKKLSTLDFIERAQKVHEITKKYNVPLLINDRIDVALAIDAEGVHVGQDDMPAMLARKLLGPNKILGVTCSNPEEVRIVCKENVADYVGLGTVYATQTKKDTKTPLGVGPIGIRKMLQALNDSIRSVAIGGINETNAAKVLYQCSTPHGKIDGVAVVSCIMAKEDAYEATKQLWREIKSTVPWAKGIQNELTNKPISIRGSGALVHHITNNVVKNFSANVTLAVGASPIMSELKDEYAEFVQIPNIALVLNLGTPTSEMMQTFIHAIQQYNKYGKHIVFDPVAAGASKARLECARLLLNAGHMSVIKGNLGEIMALWKLTSTYDDAETGDATMRGVDSIATIDESQLSHIGKVVSEEFKAIVVVSGAVNYIIDASSESIAKVKGGHELMGSITGSGCSLGSVIGAFLAANITNNLFEAVHAAVSLYNRAGEIAGQSADAPGTFMAQFLDNLYRA